MKAWIWCNNCYANRKTALALRHHRLSTDRMLLLYKPGELVSLHTVEYRKVLMGRNLSRLKDSAQPAKRTDPFKRHTPGLEVLIGSTSTDTLHHTGLSFAVLMTPDILTQTFRLRCVPKPLHSLNHCKAWCFSHWHPRTAFPLMLREIPSFGTRCTGKKY